MSNTFTKGDLAVLKSGGPRMTVRHIEGDIITCAWFTVRPNASDPFTLGPAYDELREGEFHSAMLLAVPLPNTPAE